MTYEYYVCTDNIKALREALRKNVKNKSKEGSTDPINIRKHFNEYFLETEIVHMKLNRMSKALKFDENGLYVE